MSIGRDLGVPRILGPRHDGVPCRDGERPPGRRGVPGVQCHVDEHLLQLTGIGLDDPQGWYATRWWYGARGQGAPWG
ncbi:MAG: hypothetical protein M1337_00900 [Actinobacteria bacterium]|nr:hypothetical protein [Actinomycetota bacterium]